METLNIDRYLLSKFIPTKRTQGFWENPYIHNQNRKVQDEPLDYSVEPQRSGKIVQEWCGPFPQDIGANMNGI